MPGAGLLTNPSTLSNSMDLYFFWGTFEAFRSFIVIANDESLNQISPMARLMDVIVPPLGDWFPARSLEYTKPEPNRPYFYTIIAVP
jgi:hypothetical protein